MHNDIKPKAFQCYLDNYTVLEHLSDSEAGQLWKMLFRLARGGVRETAGNPLVALAYDMMANKLERDFDAYAKKVLSLRENGKKGGAPNGNRNAQKTTKNNQLLEKTTNCLQYKDKDKNENKNENEDENENKDENENEDENKNENEDIDKEKAEDNPLSAEADVYAAAAAVLSLYRRYCPELPPVGQVTERLALRVARLPELDAEAYFRRVGASEFLTGRNGKWRGCSLDWLLRPDTVQKVLSGMYDNNESSAASYDIREMEQIDRMEWMD